MAHQHRVEKNIDIVELEDPVDLYVVPELKDFCRELASKGSRKIILSLENTKFIDSSALGMLILLATEFRQSAVSVKIVNNNKAIEHLFQLSKMQNHYEIHRSIGSAVDSFL